MEFQKTTMFCRVRKVHKHTGRIIATTYTKLRGDCPNAEDVYAQKYLHKVDAVTAFIVSECSEDEYNAKKQLPASKRSIDFLREDLYEDVRLAEYSKDYSALCGLFESLPQKALVDFFTD